MSDPFSLHGMKALITGGKRNIGRGIALALAEAGCDIGINDLQYDDDVDKTLSLVKKTGRDAAFFPANIADSNNVDQLFETFLDHFGPIDILVNNAYAGQRQHFLEIDEKEWDTTINVSLKGAFLCAQKAAMNMVNNGHKGSIINIGSAHGDRSWLDATCYGVAKAGLQRLTKNIALDLGKYGIRCNSVIPGYMDLRHDFGTSAPQPGSIRESLLDSVPLQRPSTAEDIGRAVVFLCSPAAACITGASLPVEGGMLASAGHQ